jgi:hypothetical protein
VRRVQVDLESWYRYDMSKALDVYCRPLNSTGGVGRASQKEAQLVEGRVQEFVVWPML